MKNIWSYLKIAGLFLGVLLFAACPSVFNAPSGPSGGNSGGVGVINLNLYESGSRTVLPPEAENFIYKVTFATADNGIQNVEDVEFGTNGTISQTLPFSTWNITVNAYYKDSSDDLILVGSVSLGSVVLDLDHLTVSKDGISVLVQPLSGSGYIAWNLHYPSGLDSAMLYITQKGNPVPIKEIDLNNPGVGDTSPLTLPTGSYRFRVALEATENSITKVAGDFEIVHVYPGLTSTVTMAFAENVFFELEPADVSLDTTDTNGTALLSLDREGTYGAGPLVAVSPYDHVFIKATPAVDYEVDEVIAEDQDGELTVTPDSVLDGIYWFEMSYYDVTVTVTFKLAKVELTAGSAVSAGWDDTTANATFTGASMFSNGDLSASDFTVTTGGTIDTVAIAGGTVTITVTFAANEGYDNEVFTVGIAGTSTKIKGSSEVAITQGKLRTRAFPNVNFEDSTVYWTYVDGNLNNTSGLGPTVAANPLASGNTSGNALRLSSNNAGNTRATQFNFNNASDTAAGASRHGIAFDWYPAASGMTRTHRISIQDGTGYTGAIETNGGMALLDNIFISLHVFRVGANNWRMGYTVGNPDPAFENNNNSTAEPAGFQYFTEIGQDEASKSKWYRVEVIIDTVDESIELTVKDLASGLTKFAKDDIPFASGIAYNPKIASMRFVSFRTGTDGHTLTTYIDNLDLFREAKVTALTAPAAITNLAASIGDEEAVLTWSRPSRATGYKVYYAANAAAYGAALSDQSTTGITLTGLTNGTLYKAKVVAYNSEGNAADSNEVTFTPVGVPDPVTDLVCVDAADGEAVFSWTAVPNVDGYKFYYAEASGSYSTSTTITNTVHTISGLANGTAYKAKVVAYKGSENASDSNAVTFTPVLLDYVRAIPKLHFEADALNTAYAQGASYPSAFTVAALGSGSTFTIKNNANKNGNQSMKALEFNVPNQGGARHSRVDFANATNTVSTPSARHGIAFDWNTNNINDPTTQNNYGYISIRDSASNAFLSFYVHAGAVKYRLGNDPAGSGVTNASGITDGTLVTIPGIVFGDWYRFVIIVDTSKKTVDLTITGLATDTLILQESGLSVSTSTYAGTVGIARMHLSGVRDNSNVTYTAYLDNLELFRYKEDPPITDFDVTVANASQTIQIANMQKVGATITGLANGYKYQYTAANANSFATFSINLGAKKLSDFEFVEFDFKGVSGDVQWKDFILLAASTIPSTAPIAYATHTVSSVAQSPGNSQGDPTSGKLKLNILQNATTKALTGTIDVALFSSQPNATGATGGAGSPTVFEFSNINFKLGDVCLTCGNYPCTCFTPVNGIPVVQTLGFVNVPMYLPTLALPPDATNRTIVWSTVSGTADVDGNKITPTAAGTLVLKATVTNGATSSTPYEKADVSVSVSAIPAAVGELNITNFTTSPFGYGKTNIGGNTWKLGGNYQRAGFEIGQTVSDTAYQSVTITYTTDYTVRFGLWVNSGAQSGDATSGWTNLIPGENTKTITIPAGSFDRFGFDTTTANETGLTIVRVSFKQAVAGPAPVLCEVCGEDIAGSCECTQLFRLSTNTHIQGLSVGVTNTSAIWDMVNGLQDSGAAFKVVDNNGKKAIEFTTTAGHHGVDLQDSVFHFERGDVVVAVIKQISSAAATPQIIMNVQPDGWNILKYSGTNAEAYNPGAGQIKTLKGKFTAANVTTVGASGGGIRLRVGNYSDQHVFEVHELAVIRPKLPIYGNLLLEAGFEEPAIIDNGWKLDQLTAWTIEGLNVPLSVANVNGQHKKSGLAALWDMDVGDWDNQSAMWLNQGSIFKVTQKVDAVAKGLKVGDKVTLSVWVRANNIANRTGEKLLVGNQAVPGNEWGDASSGKMPTSDNFNFVEVWHVFTLAAGDIDGGGMITVGWQHESANGWSRTGLDDFYFGLND